MSETSDNEKIATKLNPRERKCPRNELSDTKNKNMYSAVFA